jgi:hypothetical protein
MKYIYLALLVISSLSVYSQNCKVSGVFYDSKDIETSGEIKIETNKKGRLFIVLSKEFKTEEGPDLDIYLSKTETVDSTSSVRIQALVSLTGFQKYAVDKSINLSDYKYLVIHCTKWNHWYGTAKLEPCED